MMAGTLAGTHAQAGGHPGTQTTAGVAAVKAGEPVVEPNERVISGGVAESSMMPSENTADENSAIETRSPSSGCNQGPHSNPSTLWLFSLVLGAGFARRWSVRGHSSRHARRRMTVPGVRYSLAPVEDKSMTDDAQAAQYRRGTQAKTSVSSSM